MPSRIVRLDLPALRNIEMPAMTIVNGSTVGNALLNVARDPNCALYAPFLKDAAKLLEVLRLALLEAGAEDYDTEHMTEGEIAITRGQRTISGQLDTIIELMKKEAEAMQIDRSAG